MKEQILIMVEQMIQGDNYLLKLGGTQLKMAKEDVIHWKGTSLEFDASNRTELEYYKKHKTLNGFVA